MNVYSRRTASMPQFIYDATKANATRAELMADGNGIKGPWYSFPIPANGLEAIWNHILRFVALMLKQSVIRHHPLKRQLYLGGIVRAIKIPVFPPRNDARSSG